MGAWPRHSAVSFSRAVRHRLVCPFRFLTPFSYQRVFQKCRPCCPCTGKNTRHQPKRPTMQRLATRRLVILKARPICLRAASNARHVSALPAAEVVNSEPKTLWPSGQGAASYPGFYPSPTYPRAACWRQPDRQAACCHQRKLHQSSDQFRLDRPDRLLDPGASKVAGGALSPAIVKAPEDQHR